VARSLISRDFRNASYGKQKADFRTGRHSKNIHIQVTAYNLAIDFY